MTPTMLLSGKVCMITGSTSGVGRAAALALAHMGPELVLVARNRKRGEQTVAAIIEKSGNRKVELMLADLSSQQQIRALAQNFLAGPRPLHILLNNAGVILTLLHPFARSPEKGAETAVYLCSSPEVEGVSSSANS